MAQNSFKKKLSKKHPLLAVDIIALYKNKIVLVERKNYPKGLALPGGFVNYSETVEQAAKRELFEETNLRIKNLEQFHVYSSPKRDPRWHIVSVVLYGNAYGKLKAKSDAIGIKLIDPFGRIPKLCFDHQKILKDFLKKVLLSSQKF